MVSLESAQAEVFNRAVNDAIATHIGGGVNGADIGSMADPDFVQFIQTSDTYAKNQPINPVERVATSMELDDPSETDVEEYLLEATADLLRQYAEHGIDPMPALIAADRIISHTEGYITGYSRDIGAMAAGMRTIEPRHNGLERWNSKLWVPEEDFHDRSLDYLNRAIRLLSMKQWFDDHRHHLQAGMHVEVGDIVGTNSYVTQQETVTVTSYQGFSGLLGPVLGIVPRAIKDQEARHARFYSHVERALMDEFPDETVVALRDQEVGFEMPGKEGIPDFNDMSSVAALAGILDPAKILIAQRQLNTRLGIAGREFSTDQAKHAQADLMDQDGRFGERKLARRQSALERARLHVVRMAQKSDNLLPAILGVTVVADPRTGELSFPMSE